MWVYFTVKSRKSYIVTPKLSKSPLLQSKVLPNTKLYTSSY